MYQPPHFRDDAPESHAALIRAYPLGLLITNGANGMIVNPIPFLFDPAAGTKGVLRCHVARANGQWREIGTACEALVIFQGGGHYIHPGWYETKRETGKVVPTWNYEMVQVRGIARVQDDSVWLGRQIRDLTGMMEGHYPAPWAVDDAPSDFIDAQMRGIVGIEIEITAMDGKAKLSQNRNEADRKGVVAGLSVRAVKGASEMADRVQAKLERKTSGGAA